MRDAVRREVERILLRNLGLAGVLLLVVATVYASPLFAARPREVFAAFALSVCAGLFGSYAALAATRGDLVQLAAFAVLAVAMLTLLTRHPPLPQVFAIAAFELAAAVAFRALAVARWRRVDFRLRPLPLARMLRNALGAAARSGRCLTLTIDAKVRHRPEPADYQRQRFGLKSVASAAS